MTAPITTPIRYITEHRNCLPIGKILVNTNVSTVIVRGYTHNDCETCYRRANYKLHVYHYQVRYKYDICSYCLHSTYNIYDDHQS
jgi:hypothetical protein